MHIFDKLREAEIDGVAGLLERLDGGSAVADDAATPARYGELLATDEGDLWSLVLALCRLEETIEQAAGSLELSIVAKYAFQLAQSFNRFYHGYPILQAETAEHRTLRILVAHAFRRQLSTVLGILGIPIPARM